MPIKPLHKDDTGAYHVHYSENLGNNLTIKGFRSAHSYHSQHHICKIDLKKFPHININALREYDKQMQEFFHEKGEWVKDGFSLDVYETVEPMYYMNFSTRESVVFESMFLTKCRRILTVVPRHMEDFSEYGHDAEKMLVRAFQQHGTKEQRIIERLLKADGSMKESDPHHVSTHLPGMRAKSQHRHLVTPHPISESQMTELINHMVSKKLVGGFPKPASGSKFAPTPEMKMIDTSVVEAELKRCMTTLRNPMEGQNMAQDQAMEDYAMEGQ